MKKLKLLALASICCLCFFAAKAVAQEEADGLIRDYRVTEIANKYLALLSTVYVEEATQMGTNGYHSALEPRDEQDEIIKKQSLAALRDGLGAIKPQGLSFNKKADYYILQELLNKKYFDMEIAKELTQNPLWYLQAVDAVYDLLLQNAMADTDKLRDGLKRLQALPAVLKEGRDNLVNPPDLFVKIALEKAQVAYSSFNNLTGILNKLSLDEYNKNQVKIAANNAKKAVKEYFDFLKQMMANKEYADFRLGSDNYLYLLNNVYQMQVELPALKKTLDKELTTTTEQLSLALTPILQPLLSEEEKVARTNAKGIIEIKPSDFYTATAKYNEHPALEGLLNAYATAFKAASVYFVDNKVLPAAAQNIVIAPAPKYLAEKLEPAAYIPPAPLLSKQISAILVNRPDKKDAATILPKLFTFTDIKISVLQDMIPGKDFMYTLGNKDSATMPKLSKNIFYINGWAKYSVNLAASENYLTSDEEKIMLAWYNYKQALLAVADYKMQTKELNYTETIEALTAAGLKQDEAEAYADTLALQPTAAVAYVLGGQKFDKLKQKYQRKLGKKFDLQVYHSKLLGLGKIPLNLLDEGLERAYAVKDDDHFINFSSI